MDMDKIYSELLANHKDGELLALCDKKIVSGFNLAMAQIFKKNYELAAGTLGETQFYVALLDALNKKINGGGKTDVAVA